MPVGMKSPIPSEDHLRELYESLTDDQIAEQYDVSASTVRRWRRRYGILSKPRGPRPVGGTRRVCKVSDEELAEAVPRSLNVTDLLRNLGMCPTGTAHYTIKERIRSLGLDTSHFGRARRILGVRGYTRPLSEYLVKGRRAPQNLKHRLLTEGHLEERCTSCGLRPTWNGKPLTLQLDHIDGDVYNNVLENLRILCPNCHAQTRTFAGRNKGRGAEQD